MIDRNVRRPSAAGLDSAQPTPPDKLLKFFPAEALALYSGLEPLVKEIGKDDADLLRTLLWLSLLVAVVFCVLFLRQFWQIETAAQIVISTGSLVLYIAALGGPFETLDGYTPLMGAAAAVVATSFMVFVRPPAPPN